MLPTVNKQIVNNNNNNNFARLRTRFCPGGADFRSFFNLPPSPPLRALTILLCFVYFTCSGKKVDVYSNKVLTHEQDLRTILNLLP